jgi:hypothetical protein
MDSEIGGDQRRANSSSTGSDTMGAGATTVRAPGDGCVTLMALSVGDRALQARAVMSFVVSGDIALVGMLSPNGFETIHELSRNDLGRFLKCVLISRFSGSNCQPHP